MIYYWDSYFTNKGLLLVDSLSRFAVNSTKDLLWMVDTLGFVPNSNMNWGMNRSQPPFLAMMVRDVYAKYKDKVWLEKSYLSLKKEYHFWTNTSSYAIENHNTSIAGLQRFSNHASSQELKEVYSRCVERGLFTVHPDAMDVAEMLRLASHMTSEAATGMDFNPRFQGRCEDFIPVELNSNLYQYEIILSTIVDELGLTNEPDWKALAKQRKDLINKYLWNDKRGMYMDYDYRNHCFSEVASVVCFYPLLAKIASKSQAKRTVRNLSLFEFEYGVSVCEKSNQTKRYQWDYPAGWPPMYLQTIEALDAYGYKVDARRICKKYLDLVTKNYISPSPVNFTGKKGVVVRVPNQIYEKYNVINGDINDLEYNAREFLGWTAGVFIWSYEYYNSTK